MRNLVLNGTPASEDGCARLATALSTPAIVKEKGGYLFKSRADEDAFHFGVLPNFLNGQRTYHYDIDIGPSAFNLIGSINPNGTLTAVFRRDRAKTGAPLLSSEREAYRRQYAHLAGFLLECGLPGKTPLDPISLAVLCEAGLAGTDAVTLGQLSAWTTSSPETPA